jgi:hypothetical protein
MQLHYVACSSYDEMVMHFVEKPKVIIAWGCLGEQYSPSRFFGVGISFGS